MTKHEYKLLRMVKIASAIVLVEDSKLMEELAKH